MKRTAQATEFCLALKVEGSTAEVARTPPYESLLAHLLIAALQIVDAADDAKTMATEAQRKWPALSE